MIELLGLALFGWGVSGLLKKEPEPPPEEKEKNFTCALKVDGQAEIFLRWEENGRPLWPSIEKSVRRWARQQTGDVSQVEKWNELESTLRQFGFTAHVQHITSTIPSEPQPEAPDPDKAEIDEAERKLVMFSDRMKSLDPKLEEAKIGKESVASLLTGLLTTKMRRIVNPSGYRIPPRHRGY
jgi:hypothetical protein